MTHFFIYSLLIIYLFNGEVLLLEQLSRQKRCIVIQKQSGGNADSGEANGDEDYDLKSPQPKEPKPDRFVNELAFKRHDVETISPELLKYKTMPKKNMFRKLRLKNRLIRNNIDF